MVIPAQITSIIAKVSKKILQNVESCGEVLNNAISYGDPLKTTLV
jgi:hypothetical protein